MVVGVSQMYVILVYDIKTDNGGQKVLNRTFKICKKYLCHIQNSVFEGELSEAQIVKDLCTIFCRETKEMDIK